MHELGVWRLVTVFPLSIHNSSGAQKNHNFYLWVESKLWICFSPLTKNPNLIMLAIVIFMIKSVQPMLFSYSVGIIHTSNENTWACICSEEHQYNPRATLIYGSGSSFPFPGSLMFSSLACSL